MDTVILQKAYAFHGSLAILVWKNVKVEEEPPLESGLPQLVDHSPAHKRMRLSNKPVGVIYKYTKEKGLEMIEFNRDEYYQQLEKEAFERAKEAQEKALAEGKELPPDAIKLV